MGAIAAVGSIGGISVLDGLVAIARVGVRRGGPAAVSPPSPTPDRVELSPEANQTNAASQGLSAQEPRQVRELQQRDREVRAHERAHKAAAGAYGGRVSYTYTTGPDGRRYAVKGEVPIDLSPVKGDPQATIRKAQQIRRAALAPSDPSAGDRRVAARAAQLEREARVEAQTEKPAEDEPGAGAAATSAAKAYQAQPVTTSVLDVLA